MQKSDAPATLAELTESNLRLAEANAALEAIRRAAVECAHRQAANFAKVTAMARAIARGEVPEHDRAALAATLRQLAEHCECEVREHLQTLCWIQQCNGTPNGSGLEDDDDSDGWQLLVAPPLTTH
jgi:hypothetical protein